jgi:hypothetical protein
MSRLTPLGRACAASVAVGLSLAVYSCAHAAVAPSPIRETSKPVTISDEDLGVLVALARLPGPMCAADDQHLPFCTLQINARRLIDRINADRFIASPPPVPPKK